MVRSGRLTFLDGLLPPWVKNIKEARLWEKSFLGANWSGRLTFLDRHVRLGQDQNQVVVEDCWVIVNDGGVNRILIIIQETNQNYFSFGHLEIEPSGCEPAERLTFLDGLLPPGSGSPLPDSHHWPVMVILIVHQEGVIVNHHMNCECCPVSLCIVFIVRSLWL